MRSPSGIIRREHRIEGQTWHSRHELTRKITRDRLATFLAAHATDTLTLEVGAKRQSYRALFPNTISGDIVAYAGLDAQLDAHRLPFADASFAVLLCTEVLEHCHDPQWVIDEFYRVLQPGGKLILTTRFIFPIHDAPYDYFRFTKYGLRHLCRAFAEVSVEEEARTVETTAVLAQRLAYQVRWKVPLVRIGLQGMARFLLWAQHGVAEEYGDITRAAGETNIMASGYYVIALKR